MKQFLYSSRLLLKRERYSDFCFPNSYRFHFRFCCHIDQYLWFWKIVRTVSKKPTSRIFRNKSALHEVRKGVFWISEYLCFHKTLIRIPRCFWQFFVAFCLENKENENNTKQISSFLILQLCLLVSYLLHCLEKWFCSPLCFVCINLFSHHLNHAHIVSSVIIVLVWMYYNSMISNQMNPTKCL